MSSVEHVHLSIEKCSQRQPERLDALAKALGLPLESPSFTLLRPAYPITTSEEHTRIQEALLKFRSNQYETKKSHKLLRSNPSRKVFDVNSITSKEATAVLHEFMDTNCSAGEALALIQMRADVNLSKQKSNSMVKKMTGKDQENVRSNTFKQAVESGEVDLVNVLADEADFENLTQGLSIALKLRNLEILHILMLVGADPNLCESEYNNAVKSNDVEVVRILLSGVVPVNENLATAGLYEMVRHKNLNIVYMLLGHGANANKEDPSPLEYAVEHRSIDYVAAMCMADKFPLPGHLSRCVGHVCSMLNIGRTSDIKPMQMLLTELLLAAGAEGPELSFALLQATLRGKYALVQLLIEYSSFDADTTLKALRISIRLAHLKLMQLLLTIESQGEVQNDCFRFLQSADICQSIPLKVRTAMTVELLKFSISEHVLTESLCGASSNAELEIVRLLVNAGASVDHEKGRALCIAVKHQSIDLLLILLSGELNSTTSLNGAICLLHGLPLPLKLTMTQMLLAAGAEGVEVDRLLQNAVVRCDRSPESYTLIQALLRAGANVDVGPEGCLLSAIETRNIKAFKLLRKYVPSNSDLEVAFTASNKLEDLDFRYNVVQALLSAGAKGAFVTKALIDVLERFPRAKKLSQLLVQEGKPDINLFDGKVVGQAVQHQNLGLLQLLMELKPSESTLSRAIRINMSLEEGEVRRSICAMLLEAGAKGSEVDNALLRATVLNPCDMDLVRLLITFGASIDHKSGSVLQIALQNFDIALLDLLVQQTAQTNTITRAFGQAIATGTEDQKLAACKSLLGAKTKLPPQSLGAFLPRTLDSGNDLRLFRLLLSCGASVNVQPLEAFRKAISTNNEAVMQNLMNADPTASIIQEVFEYAWRARETNGLRLLAIITQNPSQRSSISLDEYLVVAVDEDPCSIPLIQLLMVRGASPLHSDCRCLLTAARRLDVAALEALLKLLDSKHLSSVNFTAALKLSELWINPKGYDCFTSLLKFCDSTEVLDEILFYATTEYEKLPNAPSIVDHLVKCGASPDYRNGSTLEIATEMANVHLVSRLLDAQSSSSTINNAFPYIFKSAASAEVVEELINIYRMKAQATLDLNSKHKELDPVMFLCISRADRRVSMLESLVGAGAKVDQTQKLKLRSSSKKEQVSVLLMTIDKTSSAVDVAIVRYLINQGANVNFAASSSKATPLLVACRGAKANNEVIAALIQKGANVSVKDSAGLTPLMCAAKKSNLQIIQTLVEAGAPTNDGSLHESASRGKVGAVTLLLDAGHNPNFPSSLHDLQGALEVTLRESCHSQDVEGHKKVLQLLYRNDASPTFSRDGKSLLIMALDLKNADKIVPPLLDTFMGRMVNEDFNRFVEDKLVYSPISYVKLDKSKCSKRQKEQLVAVLSSYGCKEVFYHETGPQPNGFVGAPAFLVQRENEHQEELRRRAEAALQHELAMRRVKELAEAKEKAEQAAHEAAERRMKAETLERERTAKLAHDAEVRRIKRRTELEIERNRQKEASLRRQNAANRRQIEFEDEYAERRHRRDLQAALVHREMRQLGYGSSGYGSSGWALPAPRSRKQITGRVIEDDDDLDY